MATYKESGVDIEAGNEVVQRIKKSVRSTYTSNVIGDVGLFGAYYKAKFKGYREPVLVSSVDGVGTKLKIAFAMNRHDTIGQDLVNHCVNDILTGGAKPLYFMDYFATGKLVPDVAEKIISGFVKACKDNGCALIGGETAEMPGMYNEGEYDIAGTIVGIVERKKILNGKKVRKGDVMIGLPSTGLHTNGYSLARAVLLKKFSLTDEIAEIGGKLGDALLAVHRSYLNVVHPLLARFDLHAISHITGGGIEGNTSRVVPKKLKMKIDWKAWIRPALFSLIQREGSVPEEDMRKTFNLGVGLVLIVNKREADQLLRVLTKKNEKPFIVGEIILA
jgi:phosphoribosylformylglycinamidine cyclo-ligase